MTDHGRLYLRRSPESYYDQRIRTPVGTEHYCSFFSMLDMIEECKPFLQIVRIEGSSKELNDIVIISAHQDRYDYFHIRRQFVKWANSTNMWPWLPAPGLRVIACKLMLLTIL